MESAKLEILDMAEGEEGGQGSSRPLDGSLSPRPRKGCLGGG